MKDLWKPVMLMVLVQIVFSVVNVLLKLAINDGMSVRVAIAYRLIFATSFTVPVSLASEMKEKNRSKITWRVLVMAFLCGLFGGSLFQNLFYWALALTSATFVSAIYNLIPAITFILAISCGLERLSLGTAAGKAKVAGTVLGIGGAMFLTFFKGVEINIWPFHHPSLLHPHNGQVAVFHNDTGRRLLGVLCAVLSCFSYALWLIVQAKMSKEYRSHQSSTALMSLMGAIQSTAFALCVERDWDQWKLGWNIRLLAVAFSGIVASGINVIMIAWCVRMRGPLFASIFNPLMLVLVAIAGSLTLNEQLYLGSVLGSVLIVCGLYAVLWGKGKEMKKMSQLTPSKITQESEAIEIIVRSKPVDDESSQNNNINSNLNVVEESEDSSKIGPHDFHDKHNKDQGRQIS